MRIKIFPYKEPKIKKLALFILVILLCAPTFAQDTVSVPGPGGRPAFTFIADRFDPVMRQIPSSITSKRQNAPLEFVKLLAEFIDEKATCDYDRVKKVHDWVTLNIRYDTASFFSGRYSSQEADAVIRRGSGVCAGYADVFKLICDALEIECIVVSGYARGYGRRLFETENAYNSNHAWNIVTINGESYLIDSTWNAGSLSGRSFQARYKTDYLFTDPAVFIYDHFPMVSAYQLLDPPLSANEFTNLPFLKPAFFKAVKTWPDLVRVNEIAADVSEALVQELEFTLNEGYEVSFQWFTQSGTRIVATYPLNREVYKVSFPRNTGRIFLRVYVRKKGENLYRGCGEFGFDVK